MRDIPESVLPCKHRFVFAVVTSRTIFVYDTQHAHPIARVTGCHLATINDAAWSLDGNMLCCCSTDGYVTFVKFPVGALGTPLELEMIPEEVKHSHCCQYGLSREDVQSSLLPVGAAGSSGAAIDDSGAMEVDANQSGPAEEHDIAGVKEEISNDDVSSSAKKKKRINPTLVEDVNKMEVSSPLFAVQPAGQTCPISPDTVVGVSSELQSAGGEMDKNKDFALISISQPEKKAKKRIAPEFVGIAK